jgi:hypothetical protein
MSDPKLSNERLSFGAAPRGGKSSSTKRFQVSMGENKMRVHDIPSVMQEK